MMKILGERKAAAARLAELIGARAVYTKMPRCAYEVGPFAIERDGTVTASDVYYGLKSPPSRIFKATVTEK